jgi:hypothetical protein
LTSVTLGTTIASANFNTSQGTTNPFINNLRTAYFATGGGAGTYTRPTTASNVWTRSP